MNLKYALITSVITIVLFSCVNDQNIDKHLIGPIVETQSGQVEGLPNADETRYKGIENGEYEALYPFDPDEEREAAFKLAGQEKGRLNAWLWLEYRSKTAETDGYVYYFDRAIPWPEHPEFGAFHTAEVPYVFNNMNKITSHTMEKKDTVIADKISSYWVNFVKTGDPNGPGLEKWEPYIKGKHEVMRIGEGFGMIPITASEERFDFLKDQLLKE